MNSKLIIKIVSWVILIIGLLGGIILMFTKVQTNLYSTTKEFSILNFSIGFTGILMSIFILNFGYFMVNHLENQEEQLYYLEELECKIKKTRYLPSFFV